MQYAVVDCVMYDSLSSFQLTAAQSLGSAMQTMNGIGASGAWWPIDLYNYPESVMEQAADMLFNATSGIGLTSYRYNVGGGGVGVDDPS